MSAHFSPALFKFLRQLERNNNREWFEQQKDRYLTEVRDPMLHFIADFAPQLRKISRHFVADPQPQGGSLFRIYRDVRFSKDKTPYKTSAAARFNHERAKDVHAPGFYLHLGADGAFAGAGIWHPDGDSLARIRGAILDRSPEWKRAIVGKDLRGDALKRAPAGFDPDDPLIDDLKRKDYIAVVELDEKTVCARDFLDRFSAHCREHRPLVRFLTRALSLEF